jgi:hypothetical protein
MPTDSDIRKGEISALISRLTVSGEIRWHRCTWAGKGISSRFSEIGDLSLELRREEFPHLGQQEVRFVLIVTRLGMSTTINLNLIRFSSFIRSVYENSPSVPCSGPARFQGEVLNELEWMEKLPRYERVWGEMSEETKLEW